VRPPKWPRVPRLFDTTSSATIFILVDFFRQFDCAAATGSQSEPGWGAKPNLNLFLGIKHGGRHGVTDDRGKTFWDSGREIIGEKYFQSRLAR
jgi:hypothetical protein